MSSRAFFTAEADKLDAIHYPLLAYQTAAANYDMQTRIELANAADNRDTETLIAEIAHWKTQQLALTTQAEIQSHILNQWANEVAQEIPTFFTTADNENGDPTVLTHYEPLETTNPDPELPEGKIRSRSSDAKYAVRLFGACLSNR